MPRPSSLVPGLLVPGRRRREHPHEPDAPIGSAVVDCAVYRDGHRKPGFADWRDAAEEVDNADGFAWIGLYEPTSDQIAGLAERYGLHPLAVEDAVLAHQRPKLDTYGDLVFAVVKTVYYDESLPTGSAEVVETGEVMVFLGRNFVITVRHGEHGGLHALRTRLQSDPTLLALGPSAVLHGILDAAVDSYVVVCRALEDDIEETESSVFSSAKKATNSDVIYALKREVLELRHATAPLAPVLHSLSQGAVGGIAPEVRDYFRDVEDHLAGVVDRVGGFDDMLTSLVAANLARVSVLQNEDMRKISAWVAIAAVPTMIAGIYGMNFEHMPELQWSFGYPLVIAVMASFCGLLYRMFKRKGWL
jgi:magnesium transporter